MARVPFDERIGLDVRQRPATTQHGSSDVRLVSRELPRLEFTDSALGVTTGAITGATERAAEPGEVRIILEIAGPIRRILACRRAAHRELLQVPSTSPCGEVVHDDPPEVSIRLSDDTAAPSGQRLGDSFDHDVLRFPRVSRDHVRKAEQTREEAFERLIR